MVHEEKKDVLCEVCGIPFWTKGRMQEHLKVAHEGLKEHTCKSCGKSFGYQRSLYSHNKLVHENVRKHECELCQKRFFSRSDMRRHIDSFHLKKPDVWNRKGKSKKKATNESDIV